MYEKIKRWYELGAWSDERVRNAVEKGKITPGQYKAITGKDY